VFFLNGKYTSTIVVNGVNKLISKIGDNRVFYSLTGQLEQIGVDRVVYDHERGCIAKVGELDALYDVETRRMSSIGTLPLNYDEQTGCIVSIGNSTVFYANAPEQYEPVEGSYYSPVKADAEAKATVIQPIGFSFEAANRERMAGFITELSNAATCESALFKIERNIREEREAREKNDHFSDGYCSVAIELGAIKKIVALLSGTTDKVRYKAQLALLTLSKSVQDVHRTKFLQQITTEASLIIDAMTTAMSTPIQNLNETVKKESANALALFDILPFANQALQNHILEKKVLLFLVTKRKDDAFFEDIINQVLAKIILVSPAYKNAVLKAKLGQNPPPFKVSDLEVYYASRSFFSTKKSMFNDIGTDHAKLDTLLETLQKNAVSNPGGASEQTLNHFSIR